FAKDLTPSVTGQLGLSGGFGYVLGSNGSLLVVDVGPQQGTSVPDDVLYPHHLHNRNFYESQPSNSTIEADPTAGRPRIHLVSVRPVWASGAPVDTTLVPQPVPFSAQTQGQGLTPLTISMHFPDPITAHLDSWSFEYEGVLPGSLRYYGKLGTDTDTP